MITVCPLCAGRLNSETPIRRNWFLPAGGADAISFGGGALALLGTGSVAAVSVQVLGVASRRQPVTLTMSTLDGCAACASAASRVSISMARIIATSRPHAKGHIGDVDAKENRHGLRTTRL